MSEYRVYVVTGSPDGTWHVWPDGDTARVHYRTLVAANVDAEMFGLRRSSWQRIQAEFPAMVVVDHHPAAV